MLFRSFKRSDLKEVIVSDQKWLTSLRTSRGDEWEEAANEAREKYIKVMNNDAVVDSMSIEDMLGVLGAFHSVTLQTKPWSPFQDFKCTCPDSHKFCVCEHALLLTYIINPKMKVPDEFQNTKVAQRTVQIRGRPSRDAQPARRLVLEDVVHVTSVGGCVEEEEAEGDESRTWGGGEIGRAHV